MIPKTGHAFIQTMVTHQNLRGRFIIDGLGNEPRAPLTPSTHYYQRAMFSVCACLWIFRGGSVQLYPLKAGIQI